MWCKYPELKLLKFIVLLPVWNEIYFLSKKRLTCIVMQRTPATSPWRTFHACRPGAPALPDAPATALPPCRGGRCGSPSWRAAARPWWRDSLAGRRCHVQRGSGSRGGGSWGRMGCWVCRPGSRTALLRGAFWKTRRGSPGVRYILQSCKILE